MRYAGGLRQRAALPQGAFMVTVKRPDLQWNAGFRDRIFSGCLVSVVGLFGTASIEAAQIMRRFEKEIEKLAKAVDA